MPADDRGAQAAAYLRMLLVRPGGPRSVWEKHAAASPDETARAGEIDDSAVAAVVGLDDPAVRAALNGTALTEPTLRRFIEAFDLGPRHADRLRDLLRGSASVRVITGAARSELAPQIQKPSYETLAVHELHTLGPDGLPSEHQTIQVIKSTVDSLTTYPYRFDTDELVVDVIRGGRVGDIYRITDTLYGVDIVLDRPLRLDETALMHYRTIFFYHTPPPTEFRRVVLGSMRHITLWVQFHRDRLPARVWLARWDRLDHANVVEQQEIDLDEEFSVQVRFDRVDDSIVGFHWSWT